MEKEDIKQVEDLLNNLTMDMNGKFNIKRYKPTEVRDYINVDDSKLEGIDIQIHRERNGTVLFLLEFDIYNGIFPVIELHTRSKTIRLSISHGSEEDKVSFDIVDDISYLQNFKSTLPYINDLLLSVVGYRHMIEKFSNSEFKKTLKREFLINSAFD